MRYVFLRCLGLLLALGLLAACNSNESLVTQPPQANGQTSKAPGQPQPSQAPADNARRITAAELHELWEKNEVLIVDTRNEPSFKQAHIKGAVLIPTNEFASRSGELPRNKMIVAYCT